jgi:hypothetical protein
VDHLPDEEERVDQAGHAAESDGDGQEGDLHLCLQESAS